MRRCSSRWPHVLLGCGMREFAVRPLRTYSMLPKPTIPWLPRESGFVWSWRSSKWQLPSRSGYGNHRINIPLVRPLRGVCTPFPVHSQHGLLLREGSQDYRSCIVVVSVVVVTSTLAAPHVSNCWLVSTSNCFLSIAFRSRVSNSTADLAASGNLCWCLAFPWLIPLLSSRRRRGLGLLSLLR